MHLPPLRERTRDIPILAKHFLEQFAEEEHKPIHGFAPETMSLLVAHDWPGNVRELVNIVHRAVVLEQQPITTPAALPKFLTAGKLDLPNAGRVELLPGGLRPTIAAIEKRLVRDALDQADGIKKDAAKLLGISPRMFSHYLKKHDLGSES